MLGKSGFTEAAETLEDREDFESYLLAWTGRDLKYHARAETTGLEFAWACWQKAGITKQKRIDCLEDSIKDVLKWEAKRMGAVSAAALRTAIK